jgi:hypothetical protein
MPVTLASDETALLDRVEARSDPSEVVLGTGVEIFRVGDVVDGTEGSGM